MYGINIKNLETYPENAVSTGGTIHRREKTYGKSLLSGYLHEQKIKKEQKKRIL